MIARTLAGNAAMAGSPFAPRYKKSNNPITLLHKESSLSSLLDRYEQLLNSTNPKAQYLQNFLIDLTSHVLDPDEIQRFPLLTTAHERHPLYPTATGGAITQLIRNAQTKHNQFALDLTDIRPLEYLCAHLEGSANLQVYIRGNAGDAFAIGSHHGTYIVEEAGCDVGLTAKFGTYFIRRIGKESFWSTEGVKSFIAQCGLDCSVSSEKSTFIIGNSPINLCETTDCTLYREENEFGTPVTRCYTSDSNHPTKTLTMDETIELWEPFNEAFKEFDTIFGGRQ